MAGDTSAFLGNRLLGNLDQNLLSFFEQLADLRHHTVLAAAKAPSTAASAASVESAVRLATLRPL